MPFKDNNDQIPPEQQYKSYIQEGLSNRRLIYRNVLLINDQNDDRILTERAPISIDQQDNVFFRDLIIYLRDQNLIQPGSSIFFYDEQRKIFVHQGTEPITANTMIPLLKFDSDQITIKYRPIQQPYYRMNNQFESSQSYKIPQQYPSNIAQNNACRDITFPSKQHSMFDSNINNNLSNPYNTFTSNSSQNTQTTTCNQTTSNNQQNITTGSEEEGNFDVSTKAIPREKRVKERKIGYVYERVMEWRKYYESGVLNEQGRLVKVNLDVAASMVGLSRKTLDDYYKYIRKAENYNFDFKGCSEEKIGILRNFVRDRQKRSTKIEEEDMHEDDNRENVSRQEEATEIVRTTTDNTNNSTKTGDQEKNESQTTRKQTQTQTSSQNNNLPPPPPYSKEEENLYNKDYVYQHQNLQNSYQNETRAKQIAPGSSIYNQIGYNQREEMCTEENRYPIQSFNRNNSFEEEERYNPYIGADASAQNQCMDIEKSHTNQQQQQFNFNENFENQVLNNSFEMNDLLHFNKQQSMNQSSFQNEYQNIKQEQIDNNKSQDNNGASPNEDDQECNFLNDEAEMQTKLQED